MNQIFPAKYYWNGPGWYGRRSYLTAEKIPFGNPDSPADAEAWAKHYGFDSVIGWFDTEVDLIAVVAGVK